MGLETEYGVLRSGQPRSGRVAGTGVMSNPMELSAEIVSAVRAGPWCPTTARWDYATEDPSRDAREAPGVGFGPDGSAPVDADMSDGIALNALLSNGSRVYVDHGHPEYSGPETTRAIDAVTWDRAGDAIMAEAVSRLNAVSGRAPIALYKNNIDGKGASYGTHENYLIPRSIEFARVVEVMTPFLATRSVFAGSGRVGLGARGEESGFQLSQRADYIETRVALETTAKRPIVNSRDEPHADGAKWRRLHLIIGDANLLEVPSWLKMGTTSLVLEFLLAQGSIDMASVELANPVAAVRAVSRDLSLRAPCELAAGGTATALEIQARYRDAVVRAVASRFGDSVPDDVGAILSRWGSVLERLGRDLWECRRDVEWVAKLGVIEGLRERSALPWDHSRLQAADVQWSDIDPARGIARLLEAAGAVETLIPRERVEAATLFPPGDTRAWFRGEMLRRFPSEIVSASWDSLVLMADDGRLLRLPMAEPLRGTKALLGGILAESCSAREVVERIRVR